MDTDVTYLRRVVIKEELVELTGGWLPALILNQFLFWSERTRDTDAYIREENARMLREGQELPGMNLTYGWIYKTATRLSEELMIGVSRQTIRRAMVVLTENNWLLERKSPHYKWDNTTQYRPDAVKIEQDLNKIGYHLEGFYLEKPNPLPQGVQGGPSKVQNGPLDVQNGRTIPYTNTIDKEKRSLSAFADGAATEEKPKEEPRNVCSHCGSVGAKPLSDVPVDIDKATRYCSVCMLTHEILEAWKELFPKTGGPDDKVHPKLATHRKKVKTRMKSAEFREQWKEALIRASKSPHLQKSSWFQLGFFLGTKHGDENWRKCYTGFYKSFDEQINRANGHKNGVAASPEADAAWATVYRAIQSNGAKRKPTFEDSIINRAVDQVSWGALCELKVGDGQKLFVQAFASCGNGAGQPDKEVSACIDDVLGNDW